MTGEEILISFPGPPLSSFKKRRDAGKRGLLQIAWNFYTLCPYTYKNLLDTAGWDSDE